MVKRRKVSKQANVRLFILLIRSSLILLHLFSRWMFREYNELPHVFERRLEPSYEAGEEYLRLFAPSSWMNSIGRILVFLSGSLGAVCIALAAINDAILLHVKIGNWNLLWYAGMLGVAYSVGKGMLPDNSIIPRYHYNSFADMDTALLKVASHTHYYPEFWKKRGWDEIIKGVFSELFQYKLKLFVLEVMSIIVAPIVLCYSLPPCAIDICRFVQKVKVEVPGTGDHCGFATFDFDLFEDENWEGQQEEHHIHSAPTSASALDANRSTIYAKFNSSQRPKAKMGKMEKSFFNFKTVHPEWKCSSSGQDLVNRMENYQSDQAIALTLERQHHIAAASRQLERLHEIEDQMDELKDEPTGPQQINEQYVRIESRNNAVVGEAIDPYNTKREKSNLRVHFKDPSPLSHLSASRTTSKSNLASVLRYDDMGLSAELNGLLNRSTLAGTSLLVQNSIDHSLPSLQMSHHRDNENNREQRLQHQVRRSSHLYHLQFVIYVFLTFSLRVYNSTCG